MTSPDLSSSPRWRELSEPGEVAAAIIDLFDQRGSSSYTETVSQTQHAQQCGALALAAGADDATVVAAFLHDVGHLFRSDTGAPPTQDRRHEIVGANFLANWFTQDVISPIRLHVPAKRYLCATEPKYFDSLSASSVRSLALQGGPMSAVEAESFGELQHSERAVQLRRWDDLAKGQGAVTPSLGEFQDIVSRVATTPR